MDTFGKGLNFLPFAIHKNSKCRDSNALSTCRERMRLQNGYERTQEIASMCDYRITNAFFTAFFFFTFLSHFYIFLTSPIYNTRIFLACMGPADEKNHLFD